MQTRRRARLSSRPYSAVAAAEPCPRGWLAVRRSRPSKRARRVVTTIPQGDGDDDGTPLTDEILVGIFAGLPDFSDLVRCAATCRRWCRLVSGEAAFICRAKRCWTPPSPLIRSLALGFFYSPRHGAAPRFAATASASRRLGLRQPSLNALIQGLDDGLFDASRLVASRNGLLVVELQRRKRERALKLCVCNPMTGEVTVLPPLGGKEIVSPFACTVLTADDYYNNDDKSPVSVVCEPPSSPSSYHLLLVYARRGFTACRTYVSDGCRWGPEAKVRDAAPLGKKAMASMTGTGAVVVRNVAYWHVKNIAFGVRLDTLRAEHVGMPVSGHDPAGNTLLGVSPDGRLRVVQVVESMCATPATVKRRVAINVDTRRATGKEWDLEVIEVVGRFLPAETTWLRLRWMCEKSGVVFFTAGCGDLRKDVYAMSLDKQEVEKVASHHDGGGGIPSSWADLRGYEMDRTSYLSSLVMDEDDP
ncbi:hypothetical protein SEVIR_9G307400v4 [Setaria viridis]|uniref:Uncharacterized protein n=1 Tax=Setaria viridis TaxID=4556 RepID=A0A4U6T0Y5_SETVI|nr:hypothetical protein SEVIR_9G307400v2 [Setaria viridis]